MGGVYESTELPGSLQKFFLVNLGLEWPEASEGGLRAIARARSGFADSLEELGDAFTVSASGLVAAMDGEFAGAAAELLRKDLVSSVADMVGNARSLAKAAKTTALDVQKAKILLIVMAVMVLATILELLATIIFSYLVPAARLAAQISMREVLRHLVMKIQQITIQQVGTATANLAGKIVKFAALGGASMGGLDLAIQAGQMVFSDREKIDWTSVGASVLAGAAGGAVAGLAHGTAVGLRFLSRSAQTRSRTFSPHVISMGHAGYALAQVVVTPLGTVFSNLATGGKGGAVDGMLGALGSAGGKRGVSAVPGEGPAGSRQVTIPDLESVFPASPEKVRSASPQQPPNVPLEVREEVRLAANEAERSLGKLSESHFDRLLSDATRIVSQHHRTPLIRSETDPAMVRWQKLIGDLRVLAAADVHRHGAAVAGQRSAELAGKLGTERVGGPLGGAPAVPASPRVADGLAEGVAGPSSASARGPESRPATVAGPSSLSVERSESRGTEAVQPAAAADGPVTTAQPQASVVTGQPTAADSSAGAPSPVSEGLPEARPAETDAASAEQPVSAMAIAFLQPAIELAPLTPPGQLSPETQHVRRLASANSVLAESVDGEAIRADVRTMLEAAGAPPSQVTRVLDALPDLTLKDEYKKFAHEGYTVVDGHGKDAVEIVVRGGPGDNTAANTAVTTGPQDPARGTDAVATGNRRTATTEAASAPRRQGAFGHYLSLPVSQNPGAFRTVDPAVGIKGVTSTPSWRTSSTTEAQVSESVTPPDKWTSKPFDLRHEVTLARTGVPVEHRRGTLPGGIRLSSPEILDDLREIEASQTRPTGPRATFLRGDQGLLSAVSGVLHRNPGWAGAADVVGSPLRSSLQDITSSGTLSRTGTELAEGVKVVTKVQLPDALGRLRNATVELGAKMVNHRHFGSGESEEAASVSKQGRGHRSEESATAASQSPFSVNASLGLGFLWSIHDKPSVVFGNRLDLRFDAMAFRSAAESRELTASDEVTATTSASESGRLLLRTSDVTYGIRARFDDGQVFTGSHTVNEGATRWSVLPKETPEPAESRASAPFVLTKVLGAAETSFPHVGRLKARLREQLPEGVVQLETERAGNGATADNEALVDALVSKTGLAAQAPDLNGDGLSFLLVRKTHRGGNRSDELLHVVIETVRGPRGRRAPADGPTFSATGLSGEVTAKHKSQHNDSVDGSVTAGGNAGVRVGAGVRETVRSYELSGGSNRSFANSARTLETADTHTQGHGRSADGSTTHRHEIDYKVSISDDDGTRTFFVPGGEAKTTLAGQISFVPPPTVGNTSFVAVAAGAAGRPGGWTSAKLPDHFAVHGLDLPPGIARFLSEDLLGGLGKGQHLASHQLFRFAGPDRVAANLDRSVTGTYHAPLHRYGRGEGQYAGFLDRIGDVGMTIVLSNARVAGPPQKTTLTFTSTVGGVRARGGWSTSGGYTFGNGRLGIAAARPENTYAFPQLGYGFFGSDTDGHSLRVEHEQSRRTTYTGDAYLVTYDATVLLSGRDYRHLGVGPYDGTTDGGWKYAQAHRRHAVQVWVPAVEIDQLALPEGWDSGFPAAAEPATPNVAPPLSVVYDGRSPVSLDTEVTDELLSAVVREMASLRPPSATAGTWAALAGGLGGAAHRLVFGAGDEVVAARLLDQVHADISPRALENLFRERRSGGKTWSASFTGPLGVITYQLTATAKLADGTAPRAVEGWADDYTTKSTKTRERFHENVSSHSANASFRMPFYFSHPTVRGAGFSGQSGLSGNTTLRQTDTETTQETRTMSAAGNAAVYRHDVTLELEFARTAHLARSVRSLTGGLTDLLAPAATHHRAPELLLPDAARSRVRLDTLAEGRAQGRITVLPDAAYLDVPGGAVGRVVGDVLEGTLAAEETGPPPPSVPVQAAAARRTIMDGTSPGALTAGFPEALTDAGYRVDGLEYDAFYAAGFLQRHPLSALVFHADLTETWVTSLKGTGEADPKVAVSGDTTKKTSQDRTAGPMWSSLMASFPLSIFPGKTTPQAGRSTADGLVPGTSVVELPELRGVGPVLAWQQSTSTGSGGKTEEHTRRSGGELYLVRARVNWRVTPEYQGTVPPGWTRPRTTFDTISFHTDARGLDSIGLRAPDDEGDIYFDARSDFDAAEVD
ncbi:WXG100-like domain-containing protein [Amycolatopsis speibonae]|uniref:Outer membrane channel protein CpnT-like N-terminal domain-containing protein n=1 Tax=Amycolatopsis speibonae TaxID=1450224 RepID=A0ABV7PAR7_9PSEU